MPEIGLVPLARHAVAVARTVLPRDRCNFSKHRFTLPQLLALLRVIRDEGWILREAELRLREHHELRWSVGPHTVPDHATTLSRHLRRVDEAALRTAVGVVAREFQSGRCPGVTGAIEGAGLTAGTVSPSFSRRTREHRSQEPQTWTRWPELLIVADVDTQAVVTLEARRGLDNRSATLGSLVDAAHAVTATRRVVADAEFDSERNPQHLRALGATCVIRAERVKTTSRIQGIRAPLRHRFPRRQYRQRNLVERVLSATTRKLMTRAPGGTLGMLRRQAFLLGLTLNLDRLRSRPQHPPRPRLLRMSTKPDDF